MSAFVTLIACGGCDCQLLVITIVNVDNCDCPAGLLVELDALGSVLEAQEEWQADAVVIRARMLRILSLIASRYLSSGERREGCAPIAALEAVVSGLDC